MHYTVLWKESQNFLRFQILNLLEGLSASGEHIFKQTMVNGCKEEDFGTSYEDTKAV